MVSTYQLGSLPLTDFFLINSPLSLLWPITSHYHHHGSLKVGILNMAHYNLFSSEDLADFLLIVPKSERGGVLDRKLISSPYNGILRQKILFAPQEFIHMEFLAMSDMSHFFKYISALTGSLYVMMLLDFHSAKCHNNSVRVAQNRYNMTNATQGNSTRKIT